MRPSKAEFEICVRQGSEEYKRLSDLFFSMARDKQGCVSVNGIGMEIYSMDGRLDVEYSDCVTFTITTKMCPPKMITDLLESIYSEKS